MKRIWIFAMIILLLLPMALGLFSCQDGDTPSTDVSDGGDVTDQPSQDTQEDGVALILNGASDYRIVISDFAKASVQKQARNFQRVIQLVTSVTIPMVTDWEDQDNNADIPEILIGKTNRAESTAAYAALGDKQYGIQVVGKKIVISGNDETLAAATEAFLSLYCGYNSDEDYREMATITIPTDLNVIRSIYDNQGVVLYVANDDLNYIDNLESALTAQFGKVSVVDHSMPSDQIFEISRAKLVVVAGIETMPANCKIAISNYLNNGGRILMLGGPAFETELYEFEGKWYNESDYLKLALATLDDDAQQIVVDTWSTTLTDKLSPSSDNNSAMVKKIDNYGLKGSSRQLYHEVKDYSRWANLAISTNIELSRANIFSFYAKPGDDHTESFTFEIEESTGARWYVVIPFVSDDWSLYSFAPKDFTLFQGTPAADVPDYTDVKKIRIGFAESHSRIAKGHHSYYISEVTLAYIDSTLTNSKVTYFSLDGVAPLYEQYPITNAANIVTDENQVFISERDYVVPSTIISRHPGLSGIGYGKDTQARFIPLLRVTDEKGLHSGYAAWIDLYATTTAHNGDAEGSMIGYFSAVSEDFYNADGIAAVVEASTAMTRDTFLVDGGTDEYTYLHTQTEVMAGAKFVTLGSLTTEEGVVAQVELFADNKLLNTISSESIPPFEIKNSVRAIQGTYKVTNTRPDRAVVTLTLNGEVIDRLEQDIYFWEPKPLEERNYIYTEDGYFKRDGEIINFFGVNYMPSYAAARPDKNDSSYHASSTHQSLTSNGGYDPTVIYNDLARIKDIGMNAVAVWAEIDFLRDCNNSLDLLRICEEMGLYVDLSIRGTAYPLKNYNEEDVEMLIQHLHFHENDNIIAYDIAWEHRIGNYDGNWAPGDKHGPGYFIGRQTWDDDFTEWTKLQYGSIEAAEQAWGVKLSRTSQGNLLLTDTMLDDTTDKYQKAVAAYYRFIDDIVSAQMQEKLLHMEALAPNQLISFRMSMSGNALRTGSFKPSTHCFDFQTLASTMDILEPEGYQLGATDDQALQIMFANAYARYTKPDAPVVWKEYGYHVWPGAEDGNFRPNYSSQQLAADYYEYALKYALTSYTSGMFCWTSYGGYRTDEQSDYGITNPDGSDRPVTTLLREYAPLFLAQGELTDSVLIEIEKDDYIGGIYGMFDEVKDALAEAYAAGKSVTFINKTQSADGSYAYADTLLDYAVADAKTEGATYPLRYVNGMVKSFETFKENGKTYAKATICNTKQSVWRAGTVSLVSTADSDVKVDAVIEQEVGYLEEVTLTFEISGSGTAALRFEISDVAFGPLYSAEVK